MKRCLPAALALHREGRPGRALRFKGPQAFWVVRVFFDRSTRRSYLLTAGSETGTETPVLTRFADSLRACSRVRQADVD